MLRESSSENVTCDGRWGGGGEGGLVLKKQYEKRNWCVLRRSKTLPVLLKGYFNNPEVYRS